MKNNPYPLQSLRALSECGTFVDSSDPNPTLPSEGDRANVEAVCRSVRLVNPQGLHMRPAAAFAQLARQFHAEVTVRFEDRSVNGKSWVDLMLLAATPGAELIVEANGPDAQSAAEALALLLAADAADSAGPL